MAGELWDYESRLETTTRADDGAYDQVLAVSQGLINEQFQALFDLYKDELSKLYFKDASIGTFEGTLQAPQVLIPGADETSANINQVLLLVRFENGSLKSADGKTEIEDLKHWTFAVRVPVVPEVVPDPSTITDPKKKKKAEEKRQRISERFDHPGDYTIERLYMKLSSADWNNLDNQRSVAGLDSGGNPVSYWDWKSDDDNTGTARRLALWLGTWADSFELDARNSLGLSFKPPTINSVMPTYVPTDILHQVYTYKSKLNGAENGQTGFGGAGDCNCLLYLEMVQNGGVKPKDPRLIWSGNFATQASPDHPAVRATFLLNHEIFLGKYILPELRSLNQASDVYHNAFYWKAEKPEDNWPIYLPWYISYDPNYPSADNPKYDFTPIYDPVNPRKVVSYQWNKENEQPLRVEKKPTENCWGRAKTKDTMNTTLTWDTGAAELTFSGKTIVDEFEEWTYTENAWDRLTSYCYDTYTVTWSIKMRIVPVYSSGDLVSYLSIVLDPLPPGKSSYVEVSTNPRVYNMKTLDHSADLTNDIRNRMTGDLDRLIGNIQNHLKSAGRFTYPGSGTLIFEDAVIGRYGDLNAKVRYQKLEHKDWIIKIPRVENGTPLLMLVPPQPRLKTSRPLISSHSLSWSANGLRALQADQTLTIRGVNNTGQPVRFAAITVGFRSGHVKDCIFTTGDYEYQENKAPPPPPTETETGKETATEKAKDHGILVKLAKMKDSLTGSGSASNTPKKGVVRVSFSDDAPKLIATVGKTGVQDGATSWEVSVATPRSKTLVLPASAWVEVNITAETAFAQMQPVSINESIRDETGQDIGHFEQPIEVRVS
ncbi:hypothetical protein B0T25DRAFT_463214 [Lasiosphaeria hispida]|uniref:Uncharacterized protein n=1 Tax=Lasiosphaeria hispida TaxID=260671 RepID=A0AAJ0H9V6_9PEZI|nr:hypothetical protein B0T25DRAFT_463214 [Lasiosphaeria hispida]